MAKYIFPVVIQLRGGEELAIRPIPLNDVSRLEALSFWLWPDGICMPFHSQLKELQINKVGLLPLKGASIQASPENGMEVPNDRIR